MGAVNYNISLMSQIAPRPITKNVATPAYGELLAGAGESWLGDLGALDAYIPLISIFGKSSVDQGDNSYVPDSDWLADLLHMPVLTMRARGLLTTVQNARAKRINVDDTAVKFNSFKMALSQQRRILTLAGVKGVPGTGILNSSNLTKVILPASPVNSATTWSGYDASSLAEQLAAIVRVILSQTKSMGRKFVIYTSQEVKALLETEGVPRTDGSIQMGGATTVFGYVAWLLLQGKAELVGIEGDDDTMIDASGNHYLLIACPESRVPYNPNNYNFNYDKFVLDQSAVAEQYAMNSGWNIRQIMLPNDGYRINTQPAQTGEPGDKLASFNITGTPGMLIYGESCYCMFAQY